MSIGESVEQRAAQFTERYKTVYQQISRVIVGHDDIVHGILTCLFVGGHCLLEGVPGLGKTLLVRTLSQTLDLDFSRIQFTPDLMPADILGTNMIIEDQSGKREFQFQKGPIFTQICLADEINRATPKTQSAMLETMQEKSVTISGNVYQMTPPFFVMATQNPIEQEGTYPLPEAQLDRFMFRIHVDYPNFEQELQIAEITTADGFPELTSILDRDDILLLQRIVRKVLIGRSVSAFAVRLVRATRPLSEDAPDFVKKYLTWGAGPRACQAILLGAKAHALLDGRINVSTDDIRYIAYPVLRHRLVTSFAAESDGVSTDNIVEMLIKVTSEE